MRQASASFASFSLYSSAAVVVLGAVLFAYPSLMPAYLLADRAIPLTAAWVIVLLALAVALLAARRLALLSAICALIAVLAAVLSVAKQALTPDSRTAALLLHDVPAIGPGCAATIVFLGVAVVLLHTGGQHAMKRHSLAQLLAVLGAIGAIVILVAYVYHDARADVLGACGTSAVGSSFVFLLLAVNVLGARADTGWFSFLFSDSDGGTLLRRLIPVALIVPIGLGWLWLEGKRLGLYGGDYGAVLLILANAILFAGFVWRSALKIANAEIAREHEKRNFQSLAEHLPHIIFRTDTDGRYLYMSPSISASTGLDHEHVVGKTPEEIDIPPELCARWRQSMEEVIATKSQRVIEFELLTPRGLRYFVETLVPEFDSGHSVVSILGLSVDVTGQKRTEQALRESEEMLIRAQKVANLGSFEYDLLGGGVRWSPQLYDIFGVDPTTFQPASSAVLDFVSAEGQPGIREAFEAALAQNEPFRVEHRVLRPDGTERRVLSQGEVVAWDNAGRPTRVIGTVLDVTKQRRAEEELRKRHTLESLGVLAGGIAHDFNNILTALFGNISIAKNCLQERAPDDREVLDALNHAEGAFKRARDLAQQLLTFSSGGAPIRKAASIADLLHDSVSFVLRGSTVRAEFRVDPDLWPANIDEGQISQAINNLAINAKEAMPQGGRLRLEANNVFLSKGNEFALPTGRYIQLRIKDSGAGIPKETLENIFDPYFTTKPGGSGLGLASTYSIIKRHEGHIAVNSKPGKGTTFYLYLPASTEPVSATARSAVAVPRTMGRALLMDDDESVRQVGKALLERLGFCVELARDGQEAVDLFRAVSEGGETFDILILDLTVPGGMGGKECLDCLKRIDPTVKALVSSGYCNDPVLSEYEAYGFQGVVPKPYQLGDLEAALSQVIGAPA